MSPTPSRPEPADPAAQPDEDAQHYRQMLYELAEIGMDIARTLHRQATQPAAAPDSAPAEAPQPDPTVAFDRIARAVLRTIALARTLTDPAQPNPAAQAGQRRLAARKQVIRAVEDTIHRAAHEGDRAESLIAELRDRLDDPDLDWDLANRPIPDIIADIRRDLGLASAPGDNAWRRRTPADLRDLNARAAAPSRRSGPVTAPPGPHTAPPPTQYRPDPRPGGPTPVQRAPSAPAFVPRAWPVPTDGGPPDDLSLPDHPNLPDHLSEAIARVLRHPGQCRPPPQAPEPA